MSSGGYLAKPCKCATTLNLYRTTVRGTARVITMAHPERTRGAVCKPCATRKLARLITDKVARSV